MPSTLLKPIYVSIKPAIFTLFVCLVLAHLLIRACKKIDFQRPRLGCLDGLRGYLALGVLMYHYTLSYNYLFTNKWSSGSAWYTLMGECSVALFFMITGFLFWYRLLMRENQVSWVKFFVGRILRLTPVYWFSIAIVSAVLLIFKQINFEYAPLSIAKQFFLWLFYFKFPITAAFPYSSIMASGASWTLKYEWIFYFVLTFLYVVLQLRKVLRYFLLTLVCAAVIFFALKRTYIPSLMIDTWFFIYFLVGAGAAYLYQIKTFRELSCSKTASLIAIGGLATILKNYEGLYAMPQSIFLAIFFIPVCMGNSLFGFLKLPASLLLGEMSYSIYLLHGSFLYIAYLNLTNLTGLTVLSTFEICGWMMALGVLTILVSLGSYLLIEKPFIRLGKKIFS